MSWVLAIAGFAFLIVLHEAGHFTAAKAVGMRAERFFLFFPPKLVSIRRGETEYGIGAIPLGGFVKITGMNPEEGTPADVLRSRRFLLDLAVHCTVPASLLAAQALVNRDVAQRAYYRQPVWKRIVVIAAGPFVNILLALVMFFFLATGFGVDTESTNTIGAVSDDLPAFGVLQSGDELVSVDGRSLEGLSGLQLANTVRRQINTHECAGEPTDGCEAETPVELTVLRGGEEETLSITPVFDAPEALPGEPEIEPRMVVGFGYEFERDTLPAGEAAEFAVDRLWFVTSRTAEVFAGIFEAEKREQITGIVGATEVTRQSIEFDARQALLVIAVISLSLGLVNLLPFLPLDGGHIFWAVVEKLRGRPASFTLMERSG